MRLLRIAAGLIAYVILVGRKPVTPRTPRLLKGIRAGSADFTRRLREKFPAGSSAAILEKALMEQGFARPGRGPTSSAAVFRQEGGAFFGPYPMQATVEWDQDGSDRILWVEGSVHFTGP